MINTLKSAVLARSNGVKIKKDILNHFAYICHINNFFNRIKPTLYSLPEKIAQAPTLNMFKKVSTTDFRATL